ncbi:MAG TPA: hypothetical protein VJ803_02370, partial [Gemmatimonadaceae bacterium]|nr:hypothetical protein [Gemmatimonadaceae bacterium]
AALLHAADAVEATLGALVAVAVVVAWTVHARARRREAAAAAVDDAKGYVAVLRRLRRTQRAFARFVWLVLALELVFLGRWWAGGISAHRSDLSAPIAIVSLWIPLTAIAGLLAWTVRLHRHAARELQQLDRLQDELGSQ